MSVGAHGERLRYSQASLERVQDNKTSPSPPLPPPPAKAGGGAKGAFVFFYKKK